jgi:hypothetical protein
MDDPGSQDKKKDPPDVLKAGQGDSRRSFMKKVLGFGAFSHFTLLAGNAFAAADDDCPGGLPTDDTCNNRDPDRCPGEAPPADVCPEDGNRSDDKCQTGWADADVCNEKADPESDQCEQGTLPDDLCADKKSWDNCPTGESPGDECAPKGTDADGDQCPGGDPKNGLDTCDPEGSGKAGGDDCSPGSNPLRVEDDCKVATPDTCDLYNDDSCPNGTNTESGSGFDDKCERGYLGSDQCTDGTEAKDICANWDVDVCPGGGENVDKCHPARGSKSDDYCYDAKPDNDACAKEGDKDECPGGGKDADQCPGTAPDDTDECTALKGCAGGDEPEKGQPDPDACVPPADKCHAGDKGE